MNINLFTTTAYGTSQDRNAPDLACAAVLGINAWCLISEYLQHGTVYLLDAQ